MQLSAVETTDGTEFDPEVTIGSRTDIDLGGGFAITKRSVVGLIGFKQRTYSLTVDGESYSEQMNTTYLGFSTGITF